MRLSDPRVEFRLDCRARRLTTKILSASMVSLRTFTETRQRR